MLPFLQERGKGSTKRNFLDTHMHTPKNIRFTDTQPFFFHQSSNKYPLSNKQNTLL